jgi:hypothetical protein
MHTRRTKQEDICNRRLARGVSDPAPIPSAGGRETSTGFLQVSAGFLRPAVDLHLDADQ